MLAEIKSALKSGIKLLTWLDQATKNVIEDKVDFLSKILEIFFQKFKERFSMQTHFYNLNFLRQRSCISRYAEYNFCEEDQGPMLGT